MENCLFCRIISGEIPSVKVYEDDYCYAFRDIAPQAKTHILVVPKAHVESIAQIGELDDAALRALLLAPGLIAQKEELKNGFRVVSNCGPDACQSVPHLHLHILGGEQLADKMA